jgi:hypothetical protein
MSRHHLCYYSTRCRFSQAFLEELSRSPYAKEFRFICVDPQPGTPRPVIPPTVKAVPTLIIQGEEEPRTDSQVMNWLSERRLRERSAVAPGGGFASGLGGGSVDGMGGGDDGPMAMTDDMFRGIGDESYVFFSDDTTAPLASGAMVRVSDNMMNINQMHLMTPPDVVRGGGAGMGVSAGAGGGGGGGGAGGRQSAKAKALDDAYAAYQAARDADMPKRPGPPMGRM